jgi:hypothetical protein
LDPRQCFLLCAGHRGKVKETKVVKMVYTSSIVHEPNDVSAINLTDEGSESDDDESYSKVRMKTKITPALPSPA